MMPYVSLLVSPRVALTTTDSAFYTFWNFFSINVDIVFLSLGLYPIQNYSQGWSLIYITPIDKDTTWINLPNHWLKVSIHFDNAVAFMRTLVSEAGISGKDK